MEEIGRRACEHAYKAEAIHNRLLEEEHAVTPAVVAMIGVAEGEFRAWIETLKETGHVTANPAKLLAAIAAVEKAGGKVILPAGRAKEQKPGGTASA